MFLSGYQLLGNSINIINAAISAKNKGCTTIALSGSSGGELINKVDSINVPSSNSARIQNTYIIYSYNLRNYRNRNLKMIGTVFLDRDGTVIEERNYISKIKDVKLIEKAGYAISNLNKSGFNIFVVSNQSGIGRLLF